MKLLIFLLALLPLNRLIWLGFTDGLGANPIEFITRSTGTWALVFLCLTLAMTLPIIRRLTVLESHKILQKNSGTSTIARTSETALFISLWVVGFPPGYNK